MTAQYSLKNLLAGLIFVGIGVAFAYASLGYQIGTAFRMGPGYFPLVLAGLLIILGIAILVSAFRDGPDAEQMERVPWLAVVLILGSLVFFGVTVRGLGVVPSLFITTFLSAFASKRTGFVGAILIATALVVICYAIFLEGLSLPLRAFGPWLGF